MRTKASANAPISLNAHIPLPLRSHFVACSPENFRQLSRRKSPPALVEGDLSFNTEDCLLALQGVITAKKLQSEGIQAVPLVQPCALQVDQT